MSIDKESIAAAMHVQSVPSELSVDRAIRMHTAVCRNQNASVNCWGPDDHVLWVVNVARGLDIATRVDHPYRGDPPPTDIPVLGPPRP